MKNIDLEKIKKNIGSNIRFKRKEYDLTIQELSEILDIEPGFLGLIERGERGTSLLNLIKIKNFFEISLDIFITENLKEFNVEKKDENISEKDMKIKKFISILRVLDLGTVEYLYIVMTELIKLNYIPPKIK